MIAPHLIRFARSCGVTLHLIDGQVKAIGPRQVVMLLVQPLREFRLELAEALQFPTHPIPSVPSSFERNGRRELGMAYMQHHINCRTCVAAGRGAMYGQRCTHGLSLWRAYSERSQSGSRGHSGPS